FIDELADGDDWSFVIKGHALLEAGVSHLLAHHFGHEGLLDIFGYLDMGAAKFGKIAFLSALDLLGSEDRGFIRGFGAVRSHVVHRVANGDLTLKHSRAGLSRDKQLRAHRHLARLFHAHEPTERVNPVDADCPRLTFMYTFLQAPKRIIGMSLQFELLDIQV